MDTLRKIARRAVGWLGLAAVLAPLVLLLALQYRWLERIGEAGALLREATLRNYLEAVGTEFEYYYRARAERLLNVPAEFFTEGWLQKQGKIWQSQDLAGTRTLFLVDFTRAEFGNFLVYRDAEGALVTPPSSDESLAIIIACAPWQARGATRALAAPGPLRVDEGDPAHRILLNPVTDASGVLVGIAGFVVDEDYLRGKLLPAIVEKALYAYLPPHSEGDIGVWISDGAGAPVLGEVARVAKASAAKPLPFLYSDWTVHLASSGRAEEAWARSNFVLNMGLSLLLALVLTGGLLFSLRASSRAMRLSTMKSDFVSNVSHELRTPLASIRVYAELLRSGRARDMAQVRAYGETIEAETRRLSLLIENILDLSRIESGRRSYRLAPISLEEVVADTLAAFRQRPGSRDCAVSYRGPAAPLPLLNGDAEALGRALGNLLDNACKYSQGARDIAVTLAAVAGEARLAVIDHGIGIPREEQGRIFERFHRVGKGLVHDVKGSGLGLAIVRHIAEAHGGRVTVASEPGQGSVFTLHLPLGAVAGGGAADRMQAPAAPEKEEHA
jgi:signal transduction histidine kinase